MYVYICIYVYVYNICTYIHTQVRTHTCAYARTLKDALAHMQTQTWAQFKDTAHMKYTLENGATRLNFFEIEIFVNGEISFYGRVCEMIFTHQNGTNTIEYPIYGGVLTYLFFCDVC